MSEQVVSQVKPVQLRYRMQTDGGLSAEEAELYLLAAVDEVSLACLLVQVANAHYDNPLDDAPQTPEDFARYRRFIRVISISYRNPWEIVFEVLGTAGAVAAAITAMYTLRSTRRKTEAETEKLLAETKRTEAETRKLEMDLATAEDLRKKRADYEQTKHEIGLASTIISTERQDRPIRELLAEVVLDGKDEFRIGYIDTGLSFLRETLALSLDEVMDKAKGPDAIINTDEQRALARYIANNTRLIASIRRLDDIERSATALDGDGQEPSSA